MVCRDEDHARERAGELLAKDPRVGSVEVWDAQRQIVMARRPGEPTPDGGTPDP